MSFDPLTSRPSERDRRHVLQATNVGPDANSLYVLRVVDNWTAEVVSAEVVDTRGTILYYGPYFTESGARTRANDLYSLFRKHDGDWNKVEEELR